MKKIYVEKSNTGNLMFRLMLAEHLRRLIPDSVITGWGIPEWGIHLLDDKPERFVSFDERQRVDVDALIKAVNDPGCDGLVLRSYGMRMEYFESNRDMFMAMFSSLTGGQWTAPDELVIHIRAGDLLGAPHPDYNLVPISYYRGLIERTGLRPVFVGQTRSSFYADALRASFPEARYLSGNHWIDDFQTTRNAHNIAIAVSSFGWLAAWLSTTAKKIYVPQLGLFNPEQRPDVDLVSKTDQRYVYHRFPVEKFKGTIEQMQRVLADPGRQLSNVYAWTAGGATVALP